MVADESGNLPRLLFPDLVPPKVATLSPDLQDCLHVVCLAIRVCEDAIYDSDVQWRPVRPLEPETSSTRFPLVPTRLHQRKCYEERDCGGVHVRLVCRKSIPDNSTGRLICGVSVVRPDLYGTLRAPRGWRVVVTAE